MGAAQFKEPWRTLLPAPEILDFINKYKPENEQSTHLRILLLGPVGAGKSSFINSVDSIFRNRVTTRALADAISGQSFTQMHRTFKIRNNEGTFFPFVFNDIMGLEEIKGICVEDVKLVLRGHVKEGYEFKPNRYLMENDQGYNPHPSLDDRVHVLVFVVPTGSVSLLSDKVLKKMREIRLAASQMEIPQIVILTKPDGACPKVKQNIKNIYKSGHIKEQVDKFSLLLGIPENLIYVVKNYNSEISTNDEMNLQILGALRQMVMCGEDFLNDRADQSAYATN